jgi:hypothetical protein
MSGLQGPAAAPRARPSRRPLSTVLIASVCAALAGALAGAVIAAGAAGTAGEIHACASKHGGALRLPKHGKCRKSERSLRWGRQGAHGTPGARGAAGAPGRSALDTLRAGEGLHGIWEIHGNTGAVERQQITLPVPAPQQIDGNHVIIAPSASCPGTLAAPAAAPRFACVYVSSLTTGAQLGGIGAFRPSDVDVTLDGSRYGFGIVGTRSAAGGWRALGTWAYTAP